MRCGSQDHRFSLLTLTMHGLHDSTLANIIEFSCFYVIQNVTPGVILITTRKGSPMRYVCIPWMIWIACRFIRPFGASGSPTWCQAVTQLIIATLQAINLLLINPLDRRDISHGVDTAGGFWSLLIKSVRLIAQTRAINTPWQVKNVPPHPKYYTRRGFPPSRCRFLLRQLAIASWQYLVLDIVQNVSRQKAIERGPPRDVFPPIVWSVSGGQWAERIVTHLSIWLLVNRLIGDLAYRILSIVFVGIGQESPSHWPPAFGSMHDLMTLRDFWGSFWHQFMRQPFTSISNYFARNVLNLTRSSTLERYTNLFFVFLISAIFHVIVDILQSLPVDKSGSMPFYLAFVLGIMIEDSVQEAWKYAQISGSSREVTTKLLSGITPAWRRVIGLVWVALWFGVTSTWYFTPMLQSTTEDLRMVPFSVTKYVGLKPLIGFVLSYGALVGLAFEVEI
ncbi:unnamed protein product [Penicillium salamii]|uniref:Wax synthase domain-containing protein n=1 Tax=Penicillium salamii TaxID=1612424 RepID=A0A9W4J8W2_9EURO|nr:unnamed protein product [Penicillium salamii]CAG7991924.1 unnamed protein product [Penicillium salamii]CAG8271502.1 unnamed protein product [Penicillium salamii]CAG8354814.1 unnamed protein product [Penicillium salamii]CAG8358151.1 unnamed protein product [Penicillium salamii]